jgi:hypothetical protein
MRSGRGVPDFDEAATCGAPMSSPALAHSSGNGRIAASAPPPTGGHR